MTDCICIQTGFLVLTLCNSKMWMAGFHQFPVAQCLIWIETMEYMNKCLQPASVLYLGLPGLLWVPAGDGGG